MLPMSHLYPSYVPRSPTFPPISHSMSSPQSLCSYVLYVPFYVPPCHLCPPYVHSYVPMSVYIPPMSPPHLHILMFPITANHIAVYCKSLIYIKFWFFPSTLLSVVIPPPADTKRASKNQNDDLTFPVYLSKYTDILLHQRTFSRLFLTACQFAKDHSRNKIPSENNFAHSFTKLMISAVCYCYSYFISSMGNKQIYIYWYVYYYHEPLTLCSLFA